MYLISIIIPAYNAEKFLSLTVDRLIKQPAFDRCQLILVNDGSKDNTQQICEKYADGYKNIVLISQENRGVSAARNTGVKRAEGEYILFSDADDYYVDNFIDQWIFDYLDQRKKCDLIIFNAYSSNRRRNRYSRSIKFEEGYFIARRIMSWPETFASIAYRKSFLIENDLWFDEGISMNEDLVFLTKVFYMADFVATSSKICYIYNRTPGSLSSPPFKGYNGVEAWEKGLQWFEKHARTPEDLAAARFYCGAKIGSRKLFFSKHYIQLGHSKKELIEELNRRGIWKDLQKLPSNQVMGYQMKDLEMYQKDFDGFVKMAKKEGIRTRLGLILLSIPFVRAIRDRKQYPLTEIEKN